MSDEIEKVSLALQDIAGKIDDQLINVAGHSIGFSLVVFTEKRASYISNCDRQEVITALTGLLESWNAGMPDVPAHEIS